MNKQVSYCYSTASAEVNQMVLHPHICMFICSAGIFEGYRIGYYSSSADVDRWKCYWWMLWKTKTTSPICLGMRRRELDTTFTQQQSGPCHMNQRISVQVNAGLFVRTAIPTNWLVFFHRLNWTNNKTVLIKFKCITASANCFMIYPSTMSCNLTNRKLSRIKHYFVKLPNFLQLYCNSNNLETANISSYFGTTYS